MFDDADYPCFIKDQPLLSTLVDSHGEKRTKQFLDDLCSHLPAKHLLGQEHDLRLDPTGYAENFRVVPIPHGPNEWAIIADVHRKSTEDKSESNGFSFSFTAPYKGNFGIADGHIDGHIYLPYPYYNDEALIDDLLSISMPIKVGKWHKKSADPKTTALIISGIIFLLTPGWKRAYDDYLHPRIIKLLRHCKAVGASAIKRGSKTSNTADRTKLTYDFIQPVYDGSKRKVDVIFVPDRTRTFDTLQPHLIKSGLGKVKHFLENDPDAKRKGVRVIKLYYHDNEKLYVIFFAQFLDQSFQNYG